MAGNTEQIQGINIALSVDTAQLKTGVAAAREAIRGLPTQKTVKLIASVDVTAFDRALTKMQADVERITAKAEKPIPIAIDFKVTKKSVQDLQRDIRRTIPEGINIPLRYAPSASEQSKIRGQIQAVLDAAPFTARVQWQVMPMGGVEGAGLAFSAGPGVQATGQVHEPIIVPAGPARKRKTTTAPTRTTRTREEGERYVRDISDIDAAAAAAVPEPPRRGRKRAVLKPIYSGEEDITLEQLQQLLAAGETQQVIDIAEAELGRLKGAKPGAYKTIIRGLSDFPLGRRRGKAVKTQISVLQDMLESAKEAQRVSETSLSATSAGQAGASTREDREAIIAYQREAGLRPQSEEERAAYRRRVADEIAQNKRAGARVVRRTTARETEGEKIEPLVYPTAEAEALATKAARLRSEASDIRSKGRARGGGIRSVGDIEKELTELLGGAFTGTIEQLQGRLRRKPEWLAESRGQIFDLLRERTESKRLEKVESQAQLLEGLAAVDPTIERLRYKTGKPKESEARYTARVEEARAEWDRGLMEVLGRVGGKANQQVKQEASVTAETTAEAIGEQLAAEHIDAALPPGHQPPGEPAQVTFQGGSLPVTVVHWTAGPIPISNVMATGAAGEPISRAGVPLTSREMEDLAEALIGGMGSFRENLRAEGLEGGPDVGEATDKAAAEAAEAERRRGGVVPPTLRETQKRLRPLGFSEYEIQTQSKRDIADIISQQRNKITSSQLETVGRLQFISARSAALTLTQAAESLGGEGRSRGLIQAAIARRFQSEANKAANDFLDTQESIKNVKIDIKKLSEDRTELVNQGKATTQIDGLIKKRHQEIIALKGQRQAQKEAINEALSGAAAANKEIGSFADTIRNVGIGLGSSLVTTSAFVAGFAALAAGSAVLNYALAPTLEKLLGYATVTPKVTAALAGMIREQKGAADAAIATAAANANLSETQLDLIDESLKQRASTEAGNMVLSEQVDMLHASQRVARENAQFGGFDRGLTQGTGGLLGTGLFGMRSTLDLLAQGLGGPTLFRPPPTDNALFNLTDPLREFFLGPKFTNEGLQQEFELGRDTLSFFNEAFTRGDAIGVEIVAATEDQRAEVERVADVFMEIGTFEAKQLAGILEGQNLLVTGIENERDAMEALERLNIGMQTPDPDVLIRQLEERIIPARLAGFRAESELQRQLAIPAQFALRRAAQPPKPFGTTFNLEGVGTEATGQIDELRAIVSETDMALKSMGTTGRQALLDLVPQGQKDEFLTLLTQIEHVGRQISRIEIAATQAQVNQQTKEYNNQIRIASRSLQDAKDIINGINGAQGDTLGLLEGQNIALQRQSQQLSFIANQMSLELQQRKINFQLAIAGFSAPGLTFAERAARMEEAKIEADFAQKQLDIQKQQLELAQQIFQNQVASQGISLARNIQDLQAQVALLQSARGVSQFVAASSEAINKLNLQEQELIAMAGTYIEEGMKIQQQAIQTAVTIAEQTGEAFSTILAGTSKAWNQFLLQARVAYNQLLAPFSEDGGTQYYGGDSRKFATGFLGTISGATEVVVGEAGPETVAILRNPRSVPGMGGGGGGGMFTILNIEINHPVVREDQDIQRLTDAVTRSVEESLGRRAAAFGFGTAR